MQQRTFFVTTRGAPGPRGGRGFMEKFVVVAPDEDSARALAQAEAGGDAEVTDLVEVHTIKRVAIG